jgi:DNA-binding transcriptional ArsR family regulator
VKAEGGEPYPFDWGALVTCLVHPMRVAIVEALVHIGEPLSATDLRKVFGDDLDLSFISYHVVQLAKMGAIVKVRERPVRGSLEKFYFFP